jgi:mortality factor 4-like protein 1
MPDNLKSLLVDDWENVTKNQQVVALPAKASVNQILEDFIAEEKPKRTSAADLDVLEEVIMGIKEYFDKALDKILLYRFEREQYKALRKKWEAGSGEYSEKGPLDIYGAEHLTRLFGMLFDHVSGCHLLIHSSSNYAGAHCADKYGSPVHQQTPGRVVQIHPLAKQELRQVFRHEVHDCNK